MASSVFGSFINRAMERSDQPEPRVGMGVTECLWSDRHAWEVIEVRDPLHITVRRMSHVCTTGTQTESQAYRFSSDPNGAIMHLVNRNGRWRNREWVESCVYDENGDYVRDENGDCIIRRTLGRKLGPHGWHLGHMEEYRDPCL